MTTEAPWLGIGRNLSHYIWGYSVLFALLNQTFHIRFVLIGSGLPAIPGSTSYISITIRASLHASRPTPSKGRVPVDEPQPPIAGAAPQSALLSCQTSPNVLLQNVLL